MPPLAGASNYASTGKHGNKLQLLIIMKKFLLLFVVAISFYLPVLAQPYLIDWHKIAGGGGTSANGQYTISDTIGQHDASGAMTGGNYSITVGFWSLISVVQTTRAPTLYISHSGNTVTVCWQDVSGWSLVQSGNLQSLIASWSASSTPTLTNGTNYLNVTNPTGSLFFRLKQ